MKHKELKRRLKLRQSNKASKLPTYDEINSYPLESCRATFIDFGEYDGESNIQYVDGTSRPGIGSATFKIPLEAKAFSGSVVDGEPNIIKIGNTNEKGQSSYILDPSREALEALENLYVDPESYESTDFKVATGIVDGQPVFDKDASRKRLEELQTIPPSTPTSEVRKQPLTSSDCYPVSGTSGEGIISQIENSKHVYQPLTTKKLTEVLADLYREPVKEEDYNNIVNPYKPKIETETPNPLFLKRRRAGGYMVGYDPISKSPEQIQKEAEEVYKYFAQYLKIAKR